MASLTVEALVLAGLVNAHREIENLPLAPNLTFRTSSFPKLRPASTNQFQTSTTQYITFPDLQLHHLPPNSVVNFSLIERCFVQFGLLRCHSVARCASKASVVH